MGTNVDYSTVPHETIYQHLSGGAGSVDMVEAGRGWQSIAAKLQELHSAVEQAVQGIGAAQQGAAADAATHATMKLVPWLGDSVTAANGTATRISGQAEFFGHTRDNMPQPVAVPDVSFSQNPGTWMADHAVEWLPGIQTGHEEAQVAAQQAEQRAQDLMRGYQGSSNDNLAVAQQFTPAPAVVADVSDPSPSGAGIGGASGAGLAMAGSAHPGVAHPTLAHSAPAAGHAATVAPAGTAPQVGSGVHALAAATAPQLAGGYPGSDGQTTGSGQVRPSAVDPFGSSPVLPGSGVAAGHRLSGGSRVSGGGAAVSRAAVSRAGGFGPRPTAPLADGYHPTGSAAQASTEQAGAGRNARAGGGFGGAPVGATGGSGRDGNTEHRRPTYLIEQDTNAIVGELPRVAPPVIGVDW
ncbi:MAG: PPE domain-containing protein [Pseudonocardiaceae bacterium]